MWVAWVGCATEDPLQGLVLVGEDRPGHPLDGLDEAWAERFLAGDAAFEEVFRDASGLGPVYVRASCASCHAEDGRGPGVVQKFVRLDGRGEPVQDDAALPWGHTARPRVAGGAVTPLTVPDLPDLLVSVRAPPAVFGRGYLEAIPAAAIEALAEEQAALGVVSGRVARVPWRSAADPDDTVHGYGPGDQDLLGRFGLKARIATLDEFAADALQGDMSLTSPLRPDELPNPDGLEDDLRPGVDVDLDLVNALADYVRLLAIPPRDDRPGAEGFEAAGCAACHVPALRTAADWPVPALADTWAPVYTDLLLHDLGPSFSDGLSDTDGAGPSEWRTAPLIGLRFLPRLLHDGRARTVEDAIRQHGAAGSEAAESVGAFDALPEGERRELISFVEGL